MSGRVPQAAPGASLAAHRPAIEAAVARVLASGRFILGDEVARFERELAAFVGVAQVIGCANGTDAIELALRACEVGAHGSDDEVITVAHTAVATVVGVERAGARPVLVDIDPDSCNIDPACVARAIGPRTRAIVAVHLYGRPADVVALRALADERGVLLIEDCAQAIGASVNGVRVGAFGDAAAFSFYPTKNLGALGDGGALATKRPEVAARARALREYGWRERYVSAARGMNSRLDELQAAVLAAKLPALLAENERRATIARRYDAALAARPAGPAGPGIATPAPCAAGVVHAWHQYVVHCAPRREDGRDTRDALRAWLDQHEIGSLVHYPVPVHQQPAYAHLAPPGGLPHSERAAREVLSLPMFAELSDADVDVVCDALRRFAP